MGSTVIQNQETKHVKTKEFVLYLLGIFFYTCMTGMVGSYRNAYLVNVLKITDDEASLFNTLVSVIPFILSFFISMYIDGRKTGKSGKFKPLAMFVVVPMAAVLMLSFWTPKGLSGTFLMIYLVTIAVLWGAFCTLGNSINMIANVMTPNMKERDNVISFRSISSAVGNSALANISNEASTIIICVMRPTTQFVNGTRRYLIGVENNEKLLSGDKHIVLVPNVIPQDEISINGLRYPDAAISKICNDFDDFEDESNNTYHLDMLDRNEFGIPAVKRFMWIEDALYIKPQSELNDNEKNALARYRKLAKIINDIDADY